MAPKQNVKYHQFRAPRVNDRNKFLRATPKRPARSRPLSWWECMRAVQRLRNTIDLTSVPDTPPPPPVAADIVDLTNMPVTQPLRALSSSPRASPSVPSGPPYAAHHIVPPRHKAWTPPEAEGNRWWKLSVYTVFHAVCTTIVIQLYPCTFTCDQSSK